MASKYLRNVDTQAVIEVEADSPEYRRLQKLKAADTRNPLYEEVSSETAGAATGEFIKQLTAWVPALGAAVAGDQAIGEAPFGGRVVAVTFVPEANITGQGTNFRTLRVLNRGQAGSGSVVVASLAFSSAPVTAIAFDERVIDLTGTVADRNVAAGDVLAWDETVAGTGLAGPGGLVQVDIARTP